MRKLKRFFLRVLSYLFSDGLANRTAGFFSKRLVEQFRSNATDDFLELLLRGMDLAFCLCRGFRKNIQGFKARYVFATADGTVGATADFQAGDMRVLSAAEQGWNVQVTFANGAALRNFLFSKDQDILNSLLANDVEVDGNLNYIYRFGFMVRDLERRLGAS